MSEDEFDISGLDDLIDADDIEIVLTKILIISSQEAYTKFLTLLPDEHSFSLIHAEKQEDAISHLIQEQVAITFLDYNSITNAFSLSASIHQYIPLSRIVLMAPELDMESFSRLCNDGSIDAILKVPFNQQQLMGVLTQQEAKHSINKMLVSMIQEPPKLSKASFLMLDPSLQFGTETLPLNFVGVMLVVNTIPKYTNFFEQTLAQDEMLFAGYLSSISSLGATLFENKEALKEINFGGISVIFQFYNEVQIFFFVRNLTRLNYQKAELRINEFRNYILEHFYEELTKQPFLTQDTLNKIDDVADAFDKADELEKVEFNALKQRKEVIDGDTPVIIYSNSADNEIRANLYEGKLQSPADDFNLIVESTSDVDTIINKVRQLYFHVIIIDSDSDPGTRSMADFIDFIKELSPSIQTIYLERNAVYTDTVVEAYNSDTLNFILPFKTGSQSLYRIFKNAERAALKIKRSTTSDSASATAGNMEAMKIFLRKEQESYNVEAQPELIGVIIAQDMIPVYDEFWDIDQEMDTEMITGLVKSLDNIGSEMFHEREEIKLLELGGNNVFVHRLGPYMFSFFVRHITPTTTVIIQREVEALSSLYIELLREAAGVLSYEQLQPIFSKLANEARSNFTELLRESQRG